MDNIIKQLKKGAKHTRLSLSERTEMKSALLRHVKANPVRNETFERQRFMKGNKSILSPFQINNLRNKFGRASKDTARHDFAKSTMPILVILGLLMGGSASFAAENTVPGDVLYPVKVHVNETVRGTFAVTPKAKAEWDIRLVERRLEEVEELATKTDVSAEVRQTAETNLGEYTERVHGRIAKFEEDDDSDDAILTAGELADMLRTHEGVLAGLSTQVAGAMATSTGAVVATTTNSLAGATSTTPADVALFANMQSLESILAQLREGRGHAEKKHKELKRKYHREDDDEDKGDDEDGDDDIVSSNWMPISVTGIAVGTTTSATVGTSTATTQTVMPTVLPVSRKGTDRKEREERHEEIRAMEGNASTTLVTGGATTSVDIVPAERIESRTERSTDSDSSGSRDSNDND